MSLPDITSEWIQSVRPDRNGLDPSRPYAFLWDRERASSGESVDVATVFLTNRECPWKCLMCDLWKNTTESTVPIGAIPNQIKHALQRLGPSKSKRAHLKLYNSGSFFDPRAIPVADYPAIAELANGFERVVVECHPALVNERVTTFRKLLADVRLEVALGLETVDPEVLPRLNKGVTLESFKRATDYLADHNIDLRTFVLVKPPWQNNDAAVKWAVRSVEFSIACGATVVALIPTRFGNGALEKLAEQGEFSPPRLTVLEQAYDQSLRHANSSSTRVFADLWDLGKFSRCDACFEERRKRLEQMNFEQQILPSVACTRCADEE